jgi:hypothetical protein
LIADSSDRLFLSALSSLSIEGSKSLSSPSSIASLRYSRLEFGFFGIKKWDENSDIFSAENCNLIESCFSFSALFTAK